MICPHCGKQTKKTKLCEHCKQTTDFTSRLNIWPEDVPGLIVSDQQDNIRNVKRLKVITVLLSFISVIAVVSSCLFWLSNNNDNEYFKIPISRRVLISAPPSHLQKEGISFNDGGQFVVLYENYDPNIVDEQPILTIRFGETVPTLPDHDDIVFCGWNTQRDGKGTTIQPGEPFMICISEDLVLYGQWESKTSEIPSDDIHNVLPDWWGLYQNEIEAESGNDAEESPVIDDSDYDNEVVNNDGE